MKYSTRMTKKNTSVLKFADLLDAYKKIDPDPVKEVRCGYEYYEDLLDYFNKEMIKTKKDKLYLGSLFGVKILIDPELKPNEFKIVKGQTYDEGKIAKPIIPIINKFSTGEGEKV